MVGDFKLPPKRRYTKLNQKISQKAITRARARHEKADLRAKIATLEKQIVPADRKEYHRKRLLAALRRLRYLEIEFPEIR